MINVSPVSDYDHLAEYLSYSPETGILRWKKSPRRGVSVGSAAGSLRKDGYIKIALMGRQYLAHRVGWLLTHKTWPDRVIDHLNSCRSDNRLSNLRQATVQQNTFNSGSRKSPSCLPKGVSRTSDGGIRARIMVDGKETHLGRFDCPHKAHAAYVEAAKKLHGEFANAG